MLYQAKFEGRRGFTLIETLVALAVFSLLLAMSDQVYRAFGAAGKTDAAAMTIVQALRHAQAKAQNNFGGSGWGVEIFSGKAVIFKGGDYAARDRSFDETVDLPFAARISGAAEIVFEKTTGRTGVAKTLAVSGGGRTINISINGQGTITY